MQTKKKASSLGFTSHYATPYPGQEMAIKILETFIPNGYPVIIPLFSDTRDDDLVILRTIFSCKTLFKTVANKGLFGCEAGEIIYFPAEEKGISAFMLLGLGKKSAISKTTLLNHIIQAFERAKQLSWINIQVVITPSLLTILNDIRKNLNPRQLLMNWLGSAIELSRFQNRFLRTKKDEMQKAALQSMEILFADTSDQKIPKSEIKQLTDSAKEGLILGRAVNQARELVSLPGNFLTPDALGVHAEKVAKKNSLTIRQFDFETLQKMNMNGIVSVGKGSAAKPRLIVVEYRGRKEKGVDLSLVGKGITFDSGGISLKPGQDMHEMKGDMGGAAAVLFATQAIAQAKLPLNVMCVIGAAENMPDAHAQKPGDVYQSYKGLTVEVLNTDAEGRLVLADCLHYASEYKPRHIIDVATLTGAAVVALGHHLAGLFSNQKNFSDLLFQAGEDSLDRLWPLPLYEEYKGDIKSDIADLANIGSRWGGALTAAAFLSHFVEPSIPWAHVDIAPKFIAKNDSGLHRKGATGFGVRLLFEVAKKLAH